MKRLYEPAAYAPEPGCWWHSTAPGPDWTALPGDRLTEVTVIGGGFTGLAAALRLAQDGTEVTLLEAETPGFGASTRNGGFCCLGGAKAPDALLARRFGQQGLMDWRATEKAAIHLVEQLLARHAIDADTHSQGETLLAHTPKAMAALRADPPRIRAQYGVEAQVTERADLAAAGA